MLICTFMSCVENESFVEFAEGEEFEEFEQQQGFV
jgi:hypothetical protein